MRQRRREFESFERNQCDDVTQQIASRTRYYNRLAQPFEVNRHAESIASVSGKGKSSAYFLELRHYLRHFHPSLRLNYLLGDVTCVPETPYALKSRPIGSASSNRNSVLLRLNSVRHFRFYRDRLAFRDKLPEAVWRGRSNNPERIAFAQRYSGHPLCNIGCVSHRETRLEPYLKEFMSPQRQLDYQFIVSVEGIDVATNLKWIMGSNSLCLMRRPRYETWFMEGHLKPGEHYVELAEDFSDLPEKVDFYRRHPAEAEQIIANAHRHVRQFMNPKVEMLINLKVLEHYFKLSGQLACE